MQIKDIVSYLCHGQDPFAIDCGVLVSFRCVPHLAPFASKLFDICLIDAVGRALGKIKVLRTKSSRDDFQDLLCVPHKELGPVTSWAVSATNGAKRHKMSAERYTATALTIGPEGQKLGYEGPKVIFGRREAEQRREGRRQIRLFYG